MTKVTILASHLLTVLWSLLVVLLAIFIAVMVSENLCWISPYLGLTEKNKILAFLGIGMGGILLALQAVIANRRAKAMENAASEQAKANENTERGQRQERLKNAIEHLGHASDSMRMGGAYELFHLAQDTENLRQTVMDILCAHIRRTTGDNEYRGKYKSKPSEEIQSLLTLLFVQDHEVFKGCHINLQGCWLNGTDLERAYLKNAVLTQAHMHGTNLIHAHLHGAKLIQADLYGAILMGAHLHEAMLSQANMHKALLLMTCLHGANLANASLYGAILMEAHLYGADLDKARLCRANLHKARLQEANLRSTKLQGVSVRSDESIEQSFADRMRDGINKTSDLSEVIFTGGLSREDVDSIVKDLSDEKARELGAKLEPHIGKQESNELPKDSGAITGVYTKEEAEQWIAEYKKSHVGFLEGL